MTHARSYTLRFDGDPHEPECAYVHGGELATGDIISPPHDTMYYKVWWIEFTKSGAVAHLLQSASSEAEARTRKSPR